MLRQRQTQADLDHNSNLGSNVFFCLKMYILAPIFISREYYLSSLWSNMLFWLKKPLGKIYDRKKSVGRRTNAVAVEFPSVSECSMPSGRTTLFLSKM